MPTKYQLYFCHECAVIDLYPVDVISGIVLDEQYDMNDERVH